MVGAGPAGITASILLALQGFCVTLMEAREGVQFKHLVQVVKISEGYVQCVEVTPLEDEQGNPV